MSSLTLSSRVENKIDIQVYYVHGLFKGKYLEIKAEYIG